MKKIVTLIFLLSAGPLLAQQDPLYTQYIFNPLIINPAYAGFTKDIRAVVTYRNQWTGLAGSPETFNLSGHIALADNTMGIGVIMLEDKIGSSRNSELHITYAYRIEIFDNKFISFGLQGGLLTFSNDFSGLTINPDDPKFQQPVRESAPSFGAGIIYSSDKILAGISVPKMLRSTATINDQEISLYNQHMYGYAVYVHNLSSRLKLKPFAVTRLVQGNRFNADAGMILNADDSYSLGLFTRSLTTYGVLARIDLGDMLRLGYVFELPTNRSVGMNYATHEISVGIRTKLFRFHDLGSILDF